MPQPSAHSEPTSPVVDGRAAQDRDNRARKSIDILKSSSFGTDGLSYSVAGPAAVPERELKGDYGDPGFITVDLDAATSPSSSHSSRGKKEPPLPIAIKFEEVLYTVQTHAPAPFWWDVRAVWRRMASLRVAPRKAANKASKEILRGISGSVAPGEVLAMLGPSGSGKTTLLSVLGGRAQGRVEGSVRYNDMPYSKALKRRMGYVAQDDTLFAHLTVYETLMYAALLKLPGSMSRAQKLARTNEIIMELGLDRARDTIIGGPFLRGVSGGERKRVSIGHEILTDPSVLLLDEPTSGLDSTTALRIITLLQQLAQGGRAVITTIHQPSSRVFKMFDKLMLLSEGRPLFFGAAADSLPYFESVGFRPLFATNPADYLLDLANGTYADIQLPAELASGKGAAGGEEQMQEKEGTAALQKKMREFLALAYERQLGASVLASVRALPPASSEVQHSTQAKRHWNTSWLEQFAILFVRGVKERRHEYLSWIRIVQVLAISIIVGLLWLNRNLNEIGGLQDQIGAVFFISIFWGFFPLFTAIFTFPSERAILAKERASDMYRLTAYFLSRTLSDMPMELILPVVFMLIVYFMASLRATAGAFFLSLLTVFLNVVVAQGLGFLIGAVVMDVKKATTLASVVLLTFMLAGGYYLQKIPPYIEWVKYLSFNYYSYRLMTIIQYEPDQTYACVSPETNNRCLVVDAPGLRNLPVTGGGIEAMAMLLLMAGYRVLAYIALRCMKTGL